LFSRQAKQGAKPKTIEEEEEEEEEEEGRGLPEETPPGQSDDVKRRRLPINGFLKVLR
jgi:hypothetical protein